MRLTMNVFGDFFERFRGRTNPRVPTDIPEDILDDLYNDSLGNGQRNRQEFSGSFFENPVDFISEFEEMFNNFFKGFPVMAFPLPNGQELPSIADNEINESNSTLQERMLNDRSTHQHKRHSTSQFPFFGDSLRRLLGSLNQPVTREDRNLDEELKAGDKCLDDILPRDNVKPSPSPFESLGSFSSSSITHDSHGVVHTKRTVRDSRGNEEVTITRRVDGKEHTVVHKTDEHGNKETTENIVELGTGKKCLQQKTPESSRFTTPSLSGRIRSWLFGED